MTGNDARQTDGNDDRLTKLEKKLLESAILLRRMFLMGAKGLENIFGIGKKIRDAESKPSDKNDST